MYNAALYLLINLVRILLIALQFCLFGRAIMSWVAQDDDSPLTQFLFTVTEPYLIPIRKLLQKFEAFNRMPMDLSMIVGLMIILILQAVLQAFIPPVLM